MFKENSFKLMYILRSIVLVLFILTALGSCEDDAVPKVKKAIPAAEERADEGTSTEETADEGTSTEETADEGTSTEETADESTSTEETADESTSTEETADESTSTEETADESTSTEETADESTSTEETADESTSTEETADESTSTEETADESTSTEETADESTSTEETADESTSTEETADESTSTEETADESTSTEETGDAGTEYAGLAKLASDKLVEAKVAQAAIEGPKQTAVDAKRSAEDAARGLESNPKPPVGQFRGVVGAWNAAKGLADVYVAKAVTFKRIADEAVGAANAAEVVAGTANQAAALQAQLGAMELQTMAGGTKEAADRWLRDVKAALADANAKLEAAQAPPQAPPQPAIPVIPATGLQLPTDTLPVFLFAGQSNMVGGSNSGMDARYRSSKNNIFFLASSSSADPTTAAGLKADPAVWKRGFKSLSSGQAKDTHSAFSYTGAGVKLKLQRGNGSEVSFAYHIQETLGRPIGVVKVSVNGTMLNGTANHTWNVNNVTDRSLYRLLKRTVDAAKRKWIAVDGIEKIEVVGMVWVQGESDTRDLKWTANVDRAGQYATNLTNLVNTATVDFTSQQNHFTKLYFSATKIYNPSVILPRARGYTKPNERYSSLVRVGMVQNAIMEDRGSFYTWVDRGSPEAVKKVKFNRDAGLHINGKGHDDLGKKHYNAMMRMLKANGDYKGDWTKVTTVIADTNTANR